eukprot:4842-Karenia_brevis.AAC.1
MSPSSSALVEEEGSPSRYAYISTPSLQFFDKAKSDSRLDNGVSFMFLLGCQTPEVAKPKIGVEGWVKAPSL